MTSRGDEELCFSVRWRLFCLVGMSLRTAAPELNRHAAGWLLRYAEQQRWLRRLSVDWLTVLENLPALLPQEKTDHLAEAFWNQRPKLLPTLGPEPCTLYEAVGATLRTGEGPALERLELVGVLLVAGLPARHTWQTILAAVACAPGVHPGAPWTLDTNRHLWNLVYS